MSDDPTVVDKKYLVWEGDTLRGFSRDSGLALYLSSAGASPMPIMVVGDDELVEATAVLRSDRWRVSAKDGVPIFDHEAYSRDRDGLMAAAQIDEALAWSGYGLEVRSGRVLEVEVPLLVVKPGHPEVHGHRPRQLR